MAFSLKNFVKDIGQQALDQAKVDVSDLFRKQGENLSNIILNSPQVAPIKEAEKQKEISKMAPWLLVGVAAIFLAGVFLSKKS